MCAFSFQVLIFKLFLLAGVFLAGAQNILASGFYLDWVQPEKPLQNGKAIRLDLGLKTVH